MKLKNISEIVYPAEIPSQQKKTNGNP